jgi:uncharacterized protein
MDVIIDQSSQKLAVGIKSSKTIHKDFFKVLYFWQSLTGNDGGYLIYGGSEFQERSQGIKVLPYHSTFTISESI